MRYLVGRYGVSTRRACRVIPTTRSSAYCTSRQDPLTRLRELAQTRVRFGFVGDELADILNPRRPTPRRRIQERRARS